MRKIRFEFFIYDMKLKEKFRYGTDELGKIYFMSDLHYNHFNILRMGPRPEFNTVEEMNDHIKKELSKLKKEDIVFDLGDLFWDVAQEEIYEVLGSCEAKIYKVLGNHDKQGYYIKDRNYGNGDLTKFFVRVADLFDAGFINSDTGKESTITFCHYPLMSWYRKGYGSLMIHGHNHGNLDAVNDASPDLRVDVGWDGKLAKEVGSFLVPIEKVIEHMKQKAGGDDFRSYVQNKCNVI